MRILNLTYEKQSQILFASTNRGTVIRYSHDLSHQLSSDPIYDLQSIHVVVVHNESIFGREITGKLVQWDKKSLELLQIVDLNNWLDESTARVPNACHGLTIFRDKLYVSMPTGQVARFDSKTLQLEWISDYITASNVECFNFADDNFHLLTEFTGKLYAGNIDAEMKAVTQLSGAVIHRVVYDNLYSRYWATDDFFCGITLFNKNNFAQPLRIKLSHDDVEYIDLSEDQRLALVACFDRHVHVIENHEIPVQRNRLGPFDYQVIQALWRDNDSCFVLTESGAVCVANINNNKIIRHVEPQNCVWDLQPCVQNPKAFWAGCESGVIGKFHHEKGQLRLINESQLGLGPIRRLIPVNGDQAYVLSMNGVIALVDLESRVVWQHKTAPLLRDFTLFQEQLFYCSENGDLVALNRFDGKVAWKRIFDLPLFSVSIHPSEGKLIVTEKLVADKDTLNCDNRLLVIDSESGEVLRSVVLRGNAKSITWVDDSKFLISGNGNVRSKLIAWPDLSELMRWDQYQVNTAERIQLLGEFVHTTTYGYQLNSYSIDGSMVDAAFPFEDYATALMTIGKNTIVAGGRGGFISCFKVTDGVPQFTSQFKFRRRI